MYELISVALDSAKPGGGNVGKAYSLKKNALISVYDKEGAGELARFLRDSGWNIISTGGTAAFLRAGGVEVTDVSEITGFPECFDGRVKTLHPAIHAGLLARRDNPADCTALAALEIEAIDLVCVNLYPFFEKARAGLSFDDTAEFIDIGGPSMLRAAAKNWRSVIVLSDSADYGRVIGALRENAVDDVLRKTLAGKVFNLTAAYDGAIARFFLQDDFPPYHTDALRKGAALRYGENAHQKAALYLREDRPGLLSAMEILGGKELSYNNIRDLDLAWRCVCAFGLPADGTPPLGAAEVSALLPGVDDRALPCCVAVKHRAPCGIARAATAEAAFYGARDGDPVSIFGGIVAFNAPVTLAAARSLAELFLEIVIAPAFDEDALALLRTKKNLRLIRAPFAPCDRFEAVSVDGGVLLQETNRRLLEKWELPTKAKPPAALIPDLLFALRAVSFVPSNGIVVVSGGMAAGIGGGETNRLSAAELALRRSARAASPRVLASDAFFPFPDVAEAAAAAGIAAIVQSGGSLNDGASIEACDRLGLPLVITGLRVFKH
jgi:phosphoribosylaminoimidazolecarboxamide formyltransferase/IMP cyclohydrolase